MADLIGGAEGADCRARVDQLLANCLRRLSLGNTAAAARAACRLLLASNGGCGSRGRGYKGLTLLAT